VFYNFRIIKSREITQALVSCTLSRH